LSSKSQERSLEIAERKKRGHDDSTGDLRRERTIQDGKKKEGTTIDRELDARKGVGGWSGG